MITLNLQAESPEFQALKAYLEENVSEILADKINNGVKIEKDGKTLINKKTLETFMDYAHGQAKILQQRTQDTLALHTKLYSAGLSITLKKCAQKGCCCKQIKALHRMIER